MYELTEENALVGLVDNWLEDTDASNEVRGILTTTVNKQLKQLRSRKGEPCPLDNKYNYYVESDIEVFEDGLYALVYMVGVVDGEHKVVNLKITETEGNIPVDRITLLDRDVYDKYIGVDYKGGYISSKYTYRNRKGEDPYITVSIDKDLIIVPLKNNQTTTTELYQTLHETVYKRVFELVDNGFHYPMTDIGTLVEKVFLKIAKRVKEDKGKQETYTVAREHKNLYIVIKLDTSTRQFTILELF